MDIKNCNDSEGWLKNIPYIWWEELDEIQCVRKYLFYVKNNKRKSKNTILAETKNGDFVLNAALELNKTNDDVSIYRYLVYSKKDMNSSSIEDSNPFNKKSRNRGELRINGIKLPIPEKIANSNTILLEDLYFYLNLPKVDLENIVSLFKDSQLKSIVDFEFPEERSESTYILKKDSGIMKFCFLFWYIENISQYSGTCMPVNPIDTTSEYSGYSINVNINDIDFDNIDIPLNIEEFKKMVNFCMKNDKINRIIFTLGMNYKFTNLYNGHANVIIIDKYNPNENGSLNVYVFDPWGKNIDRSKNKIVISRILDLLDIKKGNSSRTYKFIQKECLDLDLNNFDKNTNYITKLSTKLTGGKLGICQVWSLWMVDLFLRNSLSSHEELIEYSNRDLTKNNSEFIEFVKKYTDFLNTTCNKKLKEFGMKYDINSGKITNSGNIIELNNHISKSKLTNL
jgi:hypothetical protein